MKRKNPQSCNKLTHTVQPEVDTTSLSWAPTNMIQGENVFYNIIMYVTINIIIIDDLTATLTPEASSQLTRTHVR